MGTHSVAMLLVSLLSLLRAVELMQHAGFALLRVCSYMQITDRSKDVIKTGGGAPCSRPSSACMLSSWLAG